MRTSFLVVAITLLMLAVPVFAQCDNNDICDSGENETTCPNDCFFALTNVDCTPGGLRCMGSEAQICDAGGDGWMAAEECDYLCVSGYCTQEFDMEQFYSMFFMYYPIFVILLFGHRPFLMLLGRLNRGKREDLEWKRVEERHRNRLWKLLEMKYRYYKNKEWEMLKRKYRDYFRK